VPGLLRGALGRGATTRARSSQQTTAFSHFGFGVLTFDLGCLFRTEPGYNLFVTGPLNRPKDGIAPLAAVIVPATLNLTPEATEAGLGSWKNRIPA